ncbi:unnamed protein product [Malus baccata var. baccata]
MRCILFHPALLPLHTQLNQRQQLLGTHSTKLAAPHRQQHLLSLRAKAMQNAVTFLGVGPSAKSGGDISVLLQTGGVLLLVYLFSNFVVPVLVSKFFGFEKVGEEDEDDNDLFNR